MNKIKLFFTLSLFLCLGNIANLSAEIKEKSIAIVIPSYNNKDWYKRNIDSVLSQEYTNYQVIYTDDCSPDHTGNLVETYLSQHHLGHKVTLIKNNVRIGALHNLYNMIHSCDDNAIIVTLDGDDWFPDRYVLKKLNEVYSSGEVWLTYGQFQMHPNNEKGWATAMPDTIVKDNAFRDYQHLPTHLRTFYTWLFKAIKLEDFLYLGDFYSMSWDMTMMFPMIEMAGEHHRFIADIMYTYNNENAISDHRVSRQLQAHLAQIIRAKKRYTQLTKKPPMRSNNLNTHADAILFSNNSPTKLHKLLKSMQKHVTGLDTIFVLYRSINKNEKKYNNIKNKFSDIKFLKIDYNNSNFKSLFIQTYHSLKNDYVLFVKGDKQFIRSTNITTCIEKLEKSLAYAFYFNLALQDSSLKTSPQIKFVKLDNNVYAWNFAMARDIWSCANSLDTVLHRKTKILRGFLQAHYGPTPQEFEAIWANEGKLDRMGLCYTKKHIKTNG